MCGGLNGVVWSDLSWAGRQGRRRYPASAEGDEVTPPAEGDGVTAGGGRCTGVPGACRPAARPPSRPGRTSAVCGPADWRGAPTERWNGSGPAHDGPVQWTNGPAHWLSADCPSGDDSSDISCPLTSPTKRRDESCPIVRG